MKKSIRIALLSLLVVTLLTTPFALAVEAKSSNIDQGQSVSAEQVMITDGKGAEARSETTSDISSEPEYLPVSDDFYDVPFITVTRASGEVENYSLNDLFPEGIPFTADEWAKSVDADKASVVEDGTAYLIESVERSYITEVEGVSLANSLSRATRTFDWTISSNKITYSTTKLSLSVYDTISYSFSFNINNSCSLGVGLWNNANDTYINFDNISAAYGGTTTGSASGSWQMAVGGSFSFAIWNKNTYSINAVGSYSY